MHFTLNEANDNNDHTKYTSLVIVYNLSEK